MTTPRKKKPRLRLLKGLKQNPRRAWDPRPRLKVVKRAS